MADDLIQTEIRGLKEAQAKMEQVARDLHGPEMVNAMRQATLIVQADAKRLAPVDTGRLRASIMPEVRTGFMEVQGVVGTNVEYAPFQEFGTRFMAAQPYLNPALEQNAARIADLLNVSVARITDK